MIRHLKKLIQRVWFERKERVALNLYEPNRNS